MTYKNAEKCREETYKQRLKVNKTDKLTCCECRNQTFILSECSDFPFFDCVCSKCGSINSRWIK